ncbi:MAG: CYTH domain-containing protein [Deltaproteobacteria bacterium]|nr:CYTH domain-containing protein [Deltaproteobacteria bacterium]
MQSVEFRAELRDAELAPLILRAIGAKPLGSTEWEDSYFRVPDGWLKRRSAAGEPTDWVRYHRTPRVQPKIVRFEVLADEQGIERFGQHPMPLWLAIRKHRELWMRGYTTVSLDHIEHLGRFVKLEALVSPQHNVVRAHREINRIRDALSPALGEPIAEGYADLMLRQLAA